MNDTVNVESDLANVDTGKTVTMADGTVMSFGKKASKKTFLNVEEGSVCLFLATGETFVLLATEVPGCSEFFTYPKPVKRYILDGIRNKIVVSLNNSDSKSLGTAIEEAISGVKEGRGRATTVKGISLTREELAYVMLWNKHPTVFSDTQGTMPWDDLEDSEVIQDIITFWKEKSKKQRGAVKRNPWYMHYYAALALDLPIEEDPYLQEESAS